MRSRGILSSLRSRLAGWWVLRGALGLAAVVAAAVLAAVVLDATLDLPETVRARLPVGLAAAVSGLLVAGLAQLYRLGAARVARLFERANPSAGTRLTNAVQLAGQECGEAVGEFLRQETVELGRQTAARLAAWPVARVGMRVVLAAALVVALAWLGTGWLGREMFAAVWPRLADPHGDHPPYSRLRLEVQPPGAVVLYGGQVEVRATTAGMPADKLWLVARSNHHETRASMFLAPDKSFFQTLANLREPTEYFVTDGRARSKRFPITVRLTPQITWVEVTTEFPSYTGKAPRTAKLVEEAQALPADTQVRFRVASNRPLLDGQLTVTPVLGGAAREVKLQPEPVAHIVAGEFKLTEPVVFTISVRDVGRLACAEPRQGRFGILPDERPRLFVLEPGRDAVATPSFRVPVRVQATDDYGVTRVMWLRGLNRSLERPFNMQVELKRGAQSVEAAGSFDLGLLGVRPGDAIEYYFEAVDNYPKGPNVTFSKLYRLQIISLEQYQQILRAAAARKALFEPYLVLNAWLRRLAERTRDLEAKVKDGGAAAQAAALKEATALARDLEQFQAELSKLLEHPPMFDIERSFQETIQQLHQQVAKQLAQLKEGIGSGQLSGRRLGDIGDELHRLSETEEEEVGLPAEQIVAVVRVMAKADEFVKLAQQQAALTRLLERFAERHDLTPLEQMEAQELAHQERRLQQALDNLLDALQQSAAQLPDGDQFEPMRQDVKQFLEAVTELKIRHDLQSAAEQLTRLDTVTGYPPAKSAADNMDQLIAKCQSQMMGKGQQCLRFKPKLQQALGNTLEQIMAAMGMGEGQGEGGRDGYSLFNDDVGLYGPNVELAGEQAGGRDRDTPGGAHNTERLAADAFDAGVKPSAVSGRVRLQPDAKFPLRYRELVGEYFRAIAESEEEK